MNNSQTISNDKCQICLSKHHRKGKIDACSHVFCFKCLKKLAKRENVCPICREVFTKTTKAQKGRKGKTQKMTDTDKEKVLEVSQSMIGQQNVQKEDLAEKNIFAIFLGPNTRDNQVKFLKMYCVMMGLDKEEG